MVKNKIKRCFPLLLALVVLISCLPVITASAAIVKTSNLSGVWVCESDPNFGADLDFYFDFVSNGQTFTHVDIYGGDSEIYYGSTLVYDSIDGWISDKYKTIQVVGSLIVDDSEYAAFTSIYSTNSAYLYLSGSFECPATPDFADDFSFYFPFTTANGDGFSSITVDACNSKIYYGDELVCDDIDGWVFDEYRIITFDGSKAIESSVYGYFNDLYSPYTSPDPDPVYTTTIIIDGKYYLFTSTDCSPDVLMEVMDNGCTLSDNVSNSFFTYSGSGVFKGFATSQGSSVNSYPVGFTKVFSGSEGSNATYELYSISEASQPLYYSSVTVDGVTETFSSTGSAPKISMQVLDTGAVFTAAGKSVPYVYEGEGSFLGFSFSPSGDPSFTPGNSYELAAGSHILYPISDAPLPNQLTTTVNIYNNAGTQLLYSFKASSADSSPRVTVAPSASSITFTVPDQDPVVFSGVYSSFTGLALKPQATSPIVVLGQTLSIGGNTSDSVLDLYCTYESGFADPSGTDFVSWLATAVGGFLAFELWPGMSLDQVLWVILVIGILMWFLKIFM